MNKLAFALCATLLFASPVLAQSTDQGPPPPNGATPTDAGTPPPDQGGAPPPSADQGAPPPADQGAPPAGPDEGAPPAGGGKADKGGNKMKEIMQACRTQAKGQGLKGHDLRQAVMDCAVKQRPQAAGRLKCRMEGKDKGLKKDELKTFVQSCMKGSG